MLPFKLLDGVSATGASSAKDLERVATGFTMHTLTTGSPTTVEAVLQGSLDGVNWYELVRTSVADPVQTDNFADGLSGGSRGARYVRAMLFTLDGGSSPTVTMWVGVHTACSL